MPAAFLLLALILIAAAVHAQPGPSQAWLKEFGGDGQEIVTTWADTPDGGYLIGGTSSSGISGTKTTPGQGGQDYWIVKTDKAGNKVWDQTFGGPGTDQLKVIVKTRDGGYLLAGSSDSPVSGDKSEAGRGTETTGFDYWIVKITGDGTKVWDKTYGGNHDDRLADAVENADGSFLVGGSSRSGAGGEKTEDPRTHPAAPAVPPADYWVLKVSSTGAVRWDKTYGGAGDVALDTGSDELAAIEKTADGGYLIGGTSDSNAGFEKSEDAFDSGNNPAATSSDYWVLKINGAGEKEWDKTCGGFAGDRLSDINKADDSGFLLTGVSRSGVSGNKTVSPAMSGDEAGHVWAVKLDDAGAKVWERYYVARPGARNYFDNVSAVTQADGYYLFLNARDKDGLTKRLDKYNWDGRQVWSKSLADTGHYAPRKLYQVRDKTFDINKLPPQTRKLYTAFLNGWKAQIFSPAMTQNLFSAGYPDKIDLYSIRGSKNYQNYMKGFLEEGILDPKLIEIIYDLVTPVLTRFETSYALWPPGKPLPGASDASNIVKDQWSVDYNKTYGVDRSGKSAYARRRAWAGTTVTNETWGMNPTEEERKSPRYKNTPNSGRKKILYFNEEADNTSITSYGTDKHQLDMQLGSQHLFWAGYILDINRHLDPRFGEAADILWDFKTNHWEPDAPQIMGARHAVYKFYTNPSTLHHANDAHASLFHAFVEWHTWREGAPRPDDVTALRYLMQTILDDTYLVPVPANAPEAEKYVGAQIANYCHWNNGIRKLLNQSIMYAPGDGTYEAERAGTLLSLMHGKVQGTSGAMLTDAHMEAFSNLNALIIEQGPPASGVWRLPNSISGYSKSGSAQATKVLFNNGQDGTGFQYGGNVAPTLQNMEARRPSGGFYLSWDQTGRQYNLFQTRGRLHDNAVERFNVALVLADPNHSMKRAWGWLSSYLLLTLRRPEIDLLDPSSLGRAATITVETNQGVAAVSATKEVFALTNREVPAGDTEYSVLKFKGTPSIAFSPVPAKTYGDAPFALTATADTGLPLRYEVVSGPATVAGSALSLTGAGPVTVKAIHAGDDHYEPAEAGQTFTVNKAAQAIRFEALPPKNVQDRVELSAASSSGLPVSYAVVSGPGVVTGNLLAFTGEGQVVVQAGQAGDDNYEAASPVSQTILLFAGDARKDGIKLTVYPNPTNRVLKVKLEEKKETDYFFTIYDSQGNRVAAAVLPKSDKKVEIDFDLQCAADGYYYLMVSDGSETVVRRIEKRS